ncbi:RNA-directed DNA polymerase [Parastagonospora nodorum]|nr:RNA-directed DNA polymerase [Parastagonospora nodorum]
MAILSEHYGQWIIEQPATPPSAFHVRMNRAKRSPQRATAILWHKRLGHPGPSAIEHLVQQSEGVRIKGITTVECDACGRSKSKRQIRRTPRTNDEGPGERIAIDFHEYEKGSFTKEKSQMLVTCRRTRFIWDFYFKDNRPARSIIRLLGLFVQFMKKQFNITVKVIETDNEIVTVKQEVEKWCTSLSIRLEPSAPDTQAQNGGAERSGGVIKEKARAIRLDANLPWELWPEITRTAVYLYNRTPNYPNNWKTPYEVFFTRAAAMNGIVTGPRKPNQSHLKAYGCKAFAMTDDTHRGKSRLQRLDPKAWIGYLVGYQSTNIYRIWIPSMAKVISTRDVVFDEETIFNGKTEDLMDNLMHSTLEEISAWVRTMELPGTQSQQPETETFYEDDTTQEESPRSRRTIYHQGRKVVDAYPTPPPTPPPVALLVQGEMINEDIANMSTQPTSMTCPWAAAFMAGTESGHIGKHEGKPIDKAQVKRLLSKGIKPHRNQLPPLPSAQSKLEDHPLYEMFKEAEETHLQSHQQMKSWTEVQASPIKRAGHQILDCMWVYTYKLDKHHRLNKCKARLVVRGDQQRNVTSQDTYAATLAGRSFRMLMAIAAKFDLELKQYDVTNAFVHAAIDREIYMRMPRGYQKPGTLLKVQKALYGLRISPLLWQKEFTATLTSIGFQQIPQEPCCMIKDGVIIFFYVDDIIIAYHSKKESEALKAIKRIQDKYLCTGGEDLQWFLGVEVMRNRQQKTIQLSQAAYVDKISLLINHQSMRHDTPMSGIELLPRDGLAAPAEINKYQRKIGSLLFAAVTTRPDIAFATSRLARFLVNPSNEHQEAADRVLLYLKQSSNLALELGKGEGFEVASDASFADNTLDRKSSQGYAIKLFGGLVTWRASKQDTVTTSTTEAELLALSQVAKEAIFTSRLLKELQINLSDPTITIKCDNKQTIRLVTEDVAKLQTKLRHVDIHHHWLRQEVTRKMIKVDQ